jgi:hypothetical protein
MPRIIEIVLFLAPFAVFALWRLYFRTRILPIWFVVGLGCMVLVILGGLLWTRHEVAGDAQQRYRPAFQQDGRIVPGGAVTPPGSPPGSPDDPVRSP